MLAVAIAGCGWKGRSPAGAVLIGLLAGLCLHAHPTTLVLVSCALAAKNLLLRFYMETTGTKAPLQVSRYEVA